MGIKTIILDDGSKVRYGNERDTAAENAWEVTQRITAYKKTHPFANAKKDKYYAYLLNLQKEVRALEVKYNLNTQYAIQVRVEKKANSMRSKELELATKKAEADYNYLNEQQKQGKVSKEAVNVASRKMTAFKKATKDRNNKNMKFAFQHPFKTITAVLQGKTGGRKTGGKTR